MTDAIDIVKTDILILGSGGAGQLAALHASEANPRLDITIVVKGLFGKSGCTRLVQGGYNVVFNQDDSFEKHFLDTVKAGQFLNDQALVWTLVTSAPACIRELETRYGCFFDRNADGSIHQKPFAGQSFDRTVHKGDLTGIEIINRVSEQVMRRSIRRLEEHRAIELLLDRAGRQIAGAVVLDIRRGTFLVVQARAVLLATGGGPTMYRVTAASADKATDGLAMAFRCGAELCDMEMVQFHPTGLIVGSSLMTGTVLEEGLRGVGGRLYNGAGERFMEKYDPARLERSTRDVVARSSYVEITEGRASPNGGVFLDVSHLGARFVEEHFPGMVLRCRDVGLDLAREPVEVTPTAHFQMGGVKIRPDCACNIQGLFVAGEDAGTVHGANRLGGNGVAESTVFGCVAGDAMAAYLGDQPHAEIERAEVAAIVEETLGSVGDDDDSAPGVYRLRAEMQDLMWERVGVVRDAGNLVRAIARLEELREEARALRAPGGRVFNHAWQDLLNLRNQLLVSELIARSALAREESRGSHHRRDFPHPAAGTLCNIFVRRRDDTIELYQKPVVFSRVAPKTAEATAAVAQPLAAAGE
ncbi:MAG: FAD-binding protein [Acidobacteria bacterium]|nr:FAD-binding protein [Acidobacteriota bacterium]